MEIRFRPEQIEKTAYLAPTATVLGDVTVGRDSTILFGAVIRGDSESIRIGERSNVQDLAVLHADPGYPCVLGDGVTVGHAAVVHGAVVEDDVLIGIRAVVLNGACIGRGSLVAAGAVVPEGMQVPANSIVVGTPAKVRGAVEPRHQERIRHAGEHYVRAGRLYQRELKGQVGERETRGPESGSGAP